MPNFKQKKGRISFRGRGKSPLSPTPRGARAELVDLARELHRVAIETTTQLGMSHKDQQAALRLAIAGTSSRRPSKDLVDRAVELADLLSSWRKRYTNSDGTPRVLPIKGKGATLESLARKFAPCMPIRDVLAAITRHGEATILQDNRIALIGGAVIVSPKTPEMALAYLAVGFRRLAGTILWNMSLPEGKKGQGRFERQLVGRLSDRSFRKYSQVIRTQLVDAMDRGEAGLKLGSQGPGKTCGIQVFVFQDDEAPGSVAGR